ncbi:YrbA protein [Klebsiella pneumoniae]|uniref:YrbA protein n=1 Tax=Klebsiella pneumoniae TaxID=573 RepID=A0A378FV90_KLEPN|nr:YrbA protein [Klebsiella pneumoniae]
MENHEIQTVLMNALPLQEVHVSGDGSHFQVIAVGEMFDGMSRVKKQQSIYAAADGIYCRQPHPCAVDQGLYFRRSGRETANSMASKLWGIPCSVCEFLIENRING